MLKVASVRIRRPLTSIERSRAESIEDPFLLGIRAKHADRPVGRPGRPAVTRPDYGWFVSVSSLISTSGSNPIGDDEADPCVRRLAATTSSRPS